MQVPGLHKKIQQGHNGSTSIVQWFRVTALGFGRAQPQEGHRIRHRTARPGRADLTKLHFLRCALSTCWPWLQAASILACNKEVPSTLREFIE